MDFGVYVAKTVEPKSGKPTKENKAHDWHIQDDVISEAELFAVYEKVDDANA